MFRYIEDKKILIKIIRVFYVNRKLEGWNNKAIEFFIFKEYKVSRRTFWRWIKGCAKILKKKQKESILNSRNTKRRVISERRIFRNT